MLCLTLLILEKRQEEFDYKCDSYGLSHKKFTLDVPYRWNSMYLMLNNCISYKLPIIHYYNSNIVDPSKLLDDLDFEIINCFCEILKPFYDVTVKLSGIYYSTSIHVLHNLFEISMIFKKYGSIEYFAPIIDKMKSKYLKYWQGVPLLYALSGCLDPKSKIKLVNKIIDRIGKNLGVEVVLTPKKVENNLNRMYVSYTTKYDNQTSLPSLSSTPSSSM